MARKVSKKIRLGLKEYADICLNCPEDKCIYKKTCKYINPYICVEKPIVIRGNEDEY